MILQGCQLRRITVPVLLACGLVACSGRRPIRGGTGPDATGPARRIPSQPDAIRLYRQMGLLAEAGETPFVGSVVFLAGPSPDSTLVMLTMSIASRALTFAREGDRYRAAYTVTLNLRKGSDTARRIEAREIVRVTSFKETTRSDESVLFQQIFPMPPGTYELALSLRDDAGNKSSAIEATLGVPRLSGRQLSSLIPFHEAALRSSTDSLPRIVPTPRSTVTFGQDSIVPVYVEGYDASDTILSLVAAVRGEGTSAAVWSDSLTLVRRGSLFSGVVHVPVSRIGVGVATLAVWRRDGSDTTRTPLFVSFGEDLPVASFSDMLDYLRYFTAAYRIQALRDAAPDARASLWAEFLRTTDPVPGTPQHEGLRDYFARISQANARFREEGTQGWLSDRGRVFVSLGNPDQVFEPNTNAMDQRGRAQIWDYTRYRLRVVFIDQTGFGRWRMTLNSETEFESVVRRELTR